MKRAAGSSTGGRKKLGKAKVGDDDRNSQAISASLVTVVLDHHYYALRGDAQIAKGALEKARNILEEDPSILTRQEVKGSQFREGISGHINKRGRTILHLLSYHTCLPLHWASFLGDAPMTTLFLSKYPEAAQKKTMREDIPDSLPLHYAAIGGNIEIVRLLLKEFKEGASAQDYHGDLPIHCAAGNGSIPCVQTLLEAYDEGKSTTDDQGRLPIHTAVQHGHIECVKMLLDCHPDGLLVKDNNGLLPIHYGVVNNSTDIVQLFLSKKNFSEFFTPGSAPVFRPPR